MRIKYYLRGIGCGIIFSVIIMSISLGNKGNKEISDAEIIQRAKQLGMVDANDTESEEVNDSDTESSKEMESVKETESKIPTSSEKESEKENTGEKETEKDFNSGSINGLTNQNTVTDSNIADKENEKKDNSKKEDKNNKEDEKSDNIKNDKENMISSGNDSQTPEYVSFTIKRGQVCRQIAENLQKQGLVDDADAFREYMARNGLASKIRCGTFDIPKGATYQELANCITTK